MSEKAKIFIGSTTEGLKYAKALENLLFYEEIDVVIWDKIFKRPLASTIEELQQLSNFDFGIIIFTPDDITISREKEKITPRDNLIFELGLLIGYLGRDRVFPLTPMDVPIKLPSDLLGANPFPFKFDETLKTISECEKTLTFAVNKITDAVSSTGIKRSKSGEFKSGVVSNIKIHPTLAHYTDKQNLAFKIAYKGAGSLIDVEIRAYKIETVERITKPGTYYNNYRRLELKTESIPEMRMSWTTRHYYLKYNTIDEYISESMFDKNLMQDKNILFKVYVSGIDSIDHTKRFESREFKMENIVNGKFKDFAPVLKDGNIDYENVKWEDFDKIVKIKSSQ